MRVNVPRIATTTLLLVLSCAASVVLTAPVGNVTQIATGFAWLENLWFDGRGGMYASDFYHGKLWKWTRNQSTGSVQQTLWASGWKRVFGISASPMEDTVLVVAVYNDSTSGISVVSTTEPQQHRRLVWTPTSGNGLAYNTRTGLGYACNEGLFIPTLGSVMAFNARNATNSSSAWYFQRGMTATDGAFVDVATQLLYLTSSSTAEILVYNVSDAHAAGTSRGTFLYSYKAPGCWSLDDLCVSHDLPHRRQSNSNRDGPMIFAADFLAGAVRSFRADGAGNATTWAYGFHSLTSARQGAGPGWTGNSIFVTEGGTLDPADTNRGLWEVHLD